ncbi:hypothetical protein KBZ19_12360 [Synechococcus sp. L2F]|uniref:hypothetical protein n=1 Tax=Synechococcus sp. L2F TaxID=2823739 RepID=UPI0020CDBDD1|nr:hypothetical protein [Synechococcus sp. L2F]MCP9829278.1 hypothetical protein [Synechococcus sp. L2F]
MRSPEEHGDRIRRGLRQALQRGAVLGGLRPARDQENQRSHSHALLRALANRKILEDGHGKSLGAVSQELFDAGCRTKAGKPLTPEMVRRMRVRLEEAKLAFADETLDDESCGWFPAEAISEAVQARNGVALRWLLKMARKEYGDPFTERLRQTLLNSEHANWVSTALEEH